MAVDKLEIIKEDDHFVYIHKEEATTQNLAPFKILMETEYVGKRIVDLETGIGYYINTIPKSGDLFLNTRERRIKYTRSMIRTAILNCDMPTIKTVSEALKVEYATARKYIDKYDLWKVLDRRRMESVDVVESKLLELAKSGNMKSIEVYLAANYPEKYGKTSAQNTADVSVKLIFDAPPQKEDN